MTGDIREAWRIRLANAADGDQIAAIYRPIVESSPTSFELEPPSQEEMAHRAVSRFPEYPWLVIEGPESGLVGYAYAGVFRTRPAYRWSTETSIYLSAQHRGLGLGSALYRVLLKVLTDQGYVTAYAGITLPNEPSQRLHRRHGFRRIGCFPRAGYKQNAWHDVEWWHRGLASDSIPPQPPRLLTEIGIDGDWSIAPSL